MAEYIVKDQQTGEVLCQGTSKECAEYIDCDVSYFRKLLKIQPESNIKSKYSKYTFELHGEVKQGGARLRDVICCDCGVLMKNVGASRRRCPECAKKYTREQNRQHMREVRNATPVQMNIATKRKHGCEGCVYFYGDYEISSCCNYIFIKGKQRPCPPGNGCTVREERSKEK